MPSGLDNIHVWMPNLFGFKGGIQVYSAYFLTRLQDFCRMLAATFSYCTIGSQCKHQRIF